MLKEKTSQNSKKIKTAEQTIDFIEILKRKNVNLNEIDIIELEINNFYNIANDEMKKKITDFLENGVYNNILIELQKFKNEIESELKGKVLPNMLKVSQNQTTNALKGAFPNMAKNRIIKDSNYKESKYADHYTLEYKTLKGEKKNYKTKIAINDLPNIKLLMHDIMFYKFFTFMHYQFTKQNSYSFDFNTKEFIEFLGKEPTPKVIEKTNAKLNKFCKDVLPYIKLKWWRGNTESKTITPFAGVEIKRSIVSISLEVNYADSIKNSYYELPIEAGRLSDHAYLIADYMFTYARESKKDNPTLTYGTLYKKTGLPSYEEVQEGSYKRDTNKAIKEPMYKAIKEIQTTLSHRLELEFSEVNSDKWEDFIKGKVFIKILNYEKQCNSIIKLQEKKIKQAIKKSEKNKSTQ